MKILFTGFDPFGGEALNPSYEALKLLPETIAGAEVVRVEISTTFQRGGEELLAAVERHQPSWVFCVGQAGGRFGVMPEFVAINYRDARIPDNDGFQPIGEAVVAGGENAYFTAMPVKRMVQRMREAGIPASVSYTAGTYVCNDVFYRLLHHIHTRQPKLIGGFIHVPYADEQAAKLTSPAPSLSLAAIARALQIAAETAVAFRTDLTEAGGEIH
ncbi:MAG: pyroglutamyl-peptidase I [Oscillospiraceae bacterium]|nr:pyroglutamyl-peptidase I [Oscillospiraceae bacterium]